VCPLCGALQPFMASQDAFDIFNYEAGYRLDMGRLETDYLSMQRRLHPDMFINASGKERRIAASNAAAVNECYGVLCDPLKRSIALLARVGHEATVAREQKTIDDPELLIEMLEWRDVVASGDDEERTRLRCDHKDKIHACEEAIADAYEAGDWPKMDKESVRLRYLMRLGESFQDVRLA